MDKLRHLYFIRHGQTEWNAIRRMQGQWNSSLSELGKQQAHTNGQFLQTLGIEYLYVSPLDRCRQTAQIINQYLRVESEFDHRIKEWNCGDWSGEMWDQVGERWPIEFAAWRADPFYYRGPNCENFPDMIDRARPFLDYVLASQFEQIGIVSHGMIGRVMVGCLMALNPNETVALHQNNDTIIHLTLTGAADHRVVGSQHYIGGDGPHPGLLPE